MYVFMAFLSRLAEAGRGRRGKELPRGGSESFSVGVRVLIYQEANCDRFNLPRPRLRFGTRRHVAVLKLRHVQSASLSASGQQTGFLPVHDAKWFLAVLGG